jgi:hypothetical protein
MVAYNVWNEQPLAFRPYGRNEIMVAQVVDDEPVNEQAFNACSFGTVAQA